MEKTGADLCDLIDCLVEKGFVSLRGLIEAADLPDELQGGVANLLVGHGRIEVEEIFDVSAHAGIIGRWGREFDANGFASRAKTTADPPPFYFAQGAE